jgi:hypothetical protein
MKKLLKVILPPFIGFSLYFIGVRYSPDYFDLTIGQIGTGTLAGFMAFYKYTLPLLFFIAILTQLLIVMPAWNRVVHRSAWAKFWWLISLLLVCLLFAGGISYAIWDKTTGPDHLIKTFLFMTVVQLVYWSINLLVLSIIE